MLGAPVTSARRPAGAEPGRSHQSDDGPLVQVEAGMIGSFVGFRVRASVATLAVLGYRTISYWLPTLPEAVALRLRRTAGTPPSDAE